jgi:lipopolysaccharide transport system ATP-binding protein
MSDVSIKIENLSKQYRLGNVGTGTLTHDLQRFLAKVRGKEDPTLEIGMENKLSEAGGDYVYALKDVNLEIKQGDILGVIGKNGAGKSTLLKILSRVTTPTTGSIDMYGRVASLLEVGTGFHPELTGRENIFLNGAIMGMTKQEIKSKFDEIIDFAGVSKYIDTPVKRYSSGMYVRLGFAVAAHLEPEILIVDEVLAVGDAEFQKKAIGKMQDVSSNQGRTVLFVSHNMQAVKNLCKTAVLMKSGTITNYGTAQSVVEQYLQNSAKSQSEFLISSKRNAFAYAEKVIILDNNNKPSIKLALLESYSIKIQVTVKEPLPHFIVGIGFSTFEDVGIHTSFSRPMDIEPGQYEFTFKENDKFYTSGKYKLIVGISSREKTIQYVDDEVTIEFDEEFDKEKFITTSAGLILNQMQIDFKKID